MPITAPTPSMPLAVLNLGTYRVDGLYRLRNIRNENYLVYTNKVPTSAFRGFGNPQITFAVESLLDQLAEGIGMDALELRLRNAAESGRCDRPRVQIRKLRAEGMPENRPRKPSAGKRREGRRIPAGAWASRPPAMYAATVPSFPSSMELRPTPASMKGGRSGSLPEK